MKLCKKCWRPKCDCKTKRPKEKKSRPTIQTLPSLEKDAWSLFSLAVRLRDADKDGYCNCITSSARLYYYNSGIEAGHFIPSTRFATKFNWKNVNAQSHNDNCFLMGNIPAYEIAIDAKWGKGTAESLRSHRTTRKTREYLESICREAVSIIKSNSKEKNLWHWKKSVLYAKLYDAYSR